MAIDGFASEDLKLLIEFADLDGEIYLRVNAGGLPLARVHRVDAARRGQPAGLAVEGGDAFAKRGMRDRETFLGTFGIDFDRILLAASVDSSLLNACFDFVEGVGAAGCGQVFVENLIRGRQTFLRADFVVLVFGNFASANRENGNADRMG